MSELQKKNLLKLVNLDVEFDKYSTFCKILKIGWKMWKWEANLVWLPSVNLVNLDESFQIEPTVVKW